MKKTIEAVTYESPRAKVVLFEMEGALCQSYMGLSHDYYDDGGEIMF